MAGARIYPCAPEEVSEPSRKARANCDNVDASTLDRQ